MIHLQIKHRNIHYDKSWGKKTPQSGASTVVQEGILPLVTSSMPNGCQVPVLTVPLPIQLPDNMSGKAANVCVPAFPWKTQMKFLATGFLGEATAAIM